MAIFNVVRAGRKNDGYMEALIENMYKDKRVVYRNGFGVCDDSPELIVCTFDAVRNAYCKVNAIKVHCFEVFIEPEMGMSTISMVADNIGRYLFAKGFQSFIVIIDMGDMFGIVVTVNAVSFHDGSLFHDNNAHYLEIYQYLTKGASVPCKVFATNHSFFAPTLDGENYVHGMFA